MGVSCMPLANKMAAKKLEGFSQTQVCEESGIYQSRMSGFLRGNNIPCMKEAIKLCEYFDCSMDGILEVKKQNQN